MIYTTPAHDFLQLGKILEHCSCCVSSNDETDLFNLLLLLLYCRAGVKFTLNSYPKEDLPESTLDALRR
jgi:hypothetical protein